MPDASVTAALAPLGAELAAWREAGRRVTVWWRDDDAIAPGPRLDRALQFATDQALPLLVSIIPGALRPQLAAALAPHVRVWVCQHGFRHLNHARGEAPPAEFGTDRPVEAALADLVAGRDLLAKAGLARQLPVFVAPWHRLAPALAARLPELGFRGYSDHGRIAFAAAEAGLACVNTHLDLLNWPEAQENEAPPLPLEEMAQRLAQSLADMRTGEAELGPALGLLTHHRAMGDAAWRTFRLLVAYLRDSAAVEFASPERLFAAPAIVPRPAPPLAPAPVPARHPTRRSFDPLASLPGRFSAAGKTVLAACPVCGGGRFGRLWQMPLWELPPEARLHLPRHPLHGQPLRHLPALTTPQRLFCFDLCGDCESVFRNPHDGADTAAGFPREAAALRAKALLPALPAPTGILLDADCGDGTLLAALRPLLPERRLLGLAASAASAAAARARGLEVAGPALPPDWPTAGVDAILLQHGLSGGEPALARLRALLALLRPGGRLLLDSPYYGTASPQLLRPEDAVRINRHTRDFLVQALACRLAETGENGLTMRLVLEKP